jgi:hypothetical protein
MQAPALWLKSFCKEANFVEVDPTFIGFGLGLLVAYGKEKSTYPKK